MTASVMIEDSSREEREMRRLSGTDSLFLAGETPTWHQHVGGLTIVDSTNAPGFGVDALYSNIASRLPLVPKLTWKLKAVPLGLDRAVWIDDPTFAVITSSDRRFRHQEDRGRRRMPSS